MFVRRDAVALCLSALLAIACGGDSSSPSNPNPNPNPTPVTATPVTDLSVTAVSATSIRVAFTSHTGETSYNVQRAEGAGGTFATVLSPTAPAAASQISFTDAGLKAATLYRYRVISVAAASTSAPSSEASVTTPVNPSSGSADITGDITASRTLTSDTVYTLKGFIHVTNGATLTIQPGTVIKGDFNTLGSSLFIMRGAKINAVGTASSPIIFTSSRAAGSRQPGDWGGIVIVGNGLDNRSGSIPLDGTGTDGTAVVSGKNYQIIYSGGTTAADNSGTMSYVRVEFAGYSPTPGAGIGAFTFAAVGSGTHVSYLQAMASVGDAFGFAGGALDGDHLVAYETGDDMFDFSEGFSGRLQYLIGFNSQPITARSGAGAPSADNQGIESDGCFGAGCTNGFNSTPYTIPLVANFTLVACGSISVGCAYGADGGIGMMVRRGSGGYFVNGVTARFITAGISMRDDETFQRAGRVATPDVSLYDLLMRNLYFSESPSPLFQVSLNGNLQFSLDLPSNGLTNGPAVSQSLFTALPTPGSIPANVSALDWTPQAAAPIATGGMATLQGKIGAKGGNVVTGTSYMGAADPAGAKWWTGWTVYFRN
jgi:hypothetical protein